MNHDEIKQHIYSSYDNEGSSTSPAIQAEINRHLSQCPECQHEVAVWKKISHILFGVETLPGSESFVNHVMSRIEDSEKQKDWFALKPAWFLSRVLPLGALAAVGIFLIHSRPSPSPSLLAERPGFESSPYLMTSSYLNGEDVEIEGDDIGSEIEHVFL